MKLKLSVITILACAGIFFSCEQMPTSYDSKPSIEFTDSQKLTVEVSPEGEVTDVSFHSVLEWETSYVTDPADGDWVQIIPKSGKGGDSICKVSFTKNSSGERRGMTLSIISGDIQKKILFSQRPLSGEAEDGRDEDENEDQGSQDTGNGDGNDQGDGDGEDTGDGSNDGDGENEDDGDGGNEDSDGSQPSPGQSGKYGWFELPQFKYNQSGSYMIDSTDSDLYYAHHICAGGERGPGGRTARNYTVCFSAEHHCPVWVAAPRHRMYESGAKRTDAYGKDPSIPADIQYNSKSTGGGCNKGHMLGSAERLSTTATNRQVFYYTNIAPQYSDTFNTGGGGWNILEDWVDGQVCSDTLYVVIGAYFDSYTDKRGNSASPKKISFGGRSDVSCPTMFYYILMRTKSGSSGKSLSQCKTSEIKCAAFVRSHKTAKGTSVSSQDLMSVSDLEKITGFTYFPNVPHAPKSTYRASDWGL